MLIYSRSYYTLLYGTNAIGLKAFQELTVNELYDLLKLRRSEVFVVEHKRGVS